MASLNIAAPDTLAPSSKMEAGALASKASETLAEFATDFTRRLAAEAMPRLDVSELRRLEPCFTRKEIESIVAAKRVLAGRLARKEPLTVAETDRALRLARIGAQAENLFGNPEKAARWLREPSSALSGQTPMALLGTETGAQLVHEFLGQIAYGMFI